MAIVVSAVGFITFNLFKIPQTLKQSIEAVMSSDTSPLVKRLIDLEVAGEFKQVIEQYPTSVELLISGVFSFGVFGIFIYLMQIAVTFIRYYSFAAEHYDAQADALRASSDTPEVAYAFIQHFGPPSQIAKFPSTIHEKMLIAISDVAKSSKRLKKDDE